MTTSKAILDTEDPLMENASTPLYVLVDADGANENPVYGVFTKYEYAQKAADWLVKRMMDDCLAVDTEESGIDVEFDLEWLEKDIRNSLKIDPLPCGLNKLLY